MKRTLVFLLLGPVLGALGFVAVAVIASGEIHGDYGEGCAISFMFSLIVSAIAGPIDGLQAYAMPISLRAPLTAVVGGAVAVGLLLHVDANLGNAATPLRLLVRAAVIGALFAGVCSFLSNNYSVKAANSASSRDPLS